MGDKNGRVPGGVFSSGDEEMDGAVGGAMGGGDASQNPDVNNGPEKGQNPGAMDNRPSLAQNNNRPNITDASNNPGGVRDRGGVDTTNNRPNVGGGPTDGYIDDFQNKSRVGGGPTNGVNSYIDDINTRPRLDGANNNGKQRFNGELEDDYYNRPRNSALFSNINRDSNINSSENGARPRITGGFDDDFNNRPRNSALFSNLNKDSNVNSSENGARPRITGGFDDDFNNRPRNSALFSNLNKDSNVNSSENPYNNNRERVEEYDRHYNRPSNTYNRPNDVQFDRYNNRDGNIFSSASNNGRFLREETYGGARPKTFDEYNRPRERLAIYEDNPQQLRYIYEDNPRQRQGFFEESRQRAYDRPDPYREQGYGYGRNTMPIPRLDEYKEFNTWYECIKAWSASTDLPLHRQGFALANDMPKHSEKYGQHLKDDLFRAIPATQLINNEQGVIRIIEFLKNRFYVDEEKEIFEVKRQMSAIKRRAGQNINEFIIDFENLREKSIQLGIEIKNDKLLALTLFECAQLDTTEETVLRGVCQFMINDGKRYETVKRKLREICSRIKEKQNKNNEDIFLTQNSSKEDDIQRQQEQVLIAKGWKPPTRNQGYQKSGNQNNRYQNQQGRQYNDNKGQEPFYSTRKKNPVGPDGKVTRCLICESKTHYAKECPDSYENRRKSGKTQHKRIGGKKYRQVFLTDEHGDQKEVMVESAGEDTEEESVNCTVLCSDNKEEMSKFTAEALNMAALDTCCTSSVAGEQWLNIYLESLPDNMKDKVKGPMESNRQFIFGNQGKLKSKARYTIPVRIGGCYNEISFDVIKSDIPLLMSKNEMKRLGIALDMKNDKGSIDGKPLVLTTTTAGHYIVDLLQEDETLEQVNIAELDNDNDKEQMKALSKIHLQFGHRPKKAFITILKEAGKWKEKFSDMIDKIMNKCEGCLLRRRVPDKPSVAPPMANDFGQVLTIDLKVWDMHKGIYIMYMIDQFTRFQVAAVIRSKEPAQIVKAFTLKWLPIFGRVEKILTDNGTEFCNEELREVANAFNIQLLTTGANSPWQNGTNERNHKITDQIVRITRETYPNMSLEVALAWAVTAANSLSNVRGFSPYQLVFGRQIKLPNILDDPPPAWEEPTKSKTLLETLEAINKTRIEYTKAERCERLRKALKTKIRVADTLYENGDIVYFQKEGEDTWRGPAKVVFQDSKVIFIRIGSIYYRVSANRLIKAGQELVNEINRKEHESTARVDESDDDDSNDVQEEQRIHDTRSRQKLLDLALDEQEQVTRSLLDHVQNKNDAQHFTNRVLRETEKQKVQTVQKNKVAEKDKNEEDNSPATNTDQVNQDESDLPQNNENDSPLSTDNLSTDIDKHTHEKSNAKEDESKEENKNKEKEKIPLRNMRGLKRRKNSQKPTPTFNEDGTLQNAKYVLKRNDRIEILEKGKWEKGKILSHGGKVGGRNAGWFNIELDNGEVFHDEVSNRDIKYETNNDQVETEDVEVMTVIKLDNGRNLEIPNIEQRKIRIENEEETAHLMICEEILAVMVPAEQRNSPECLQAKYDELSKLQAFNTYEIVDDIGQERITTTWVLTEKGTEKRARLTARGFQEETDFPTDSPTVQKQSIRLISALAATEGWAIYTTDISSAFLQGSQMDREVFVKPPKEANLQGKLMKLNKCLYGLKDASRKWYMRVQDKLKELGFKKSPLDKGLFYMIKDGKLIGLVGIHVDDFFYAGTKEFIDQIMPKVLGIFKVGKQETKQFMYTGFMFKQDKDGITIDQDKYVDNANPPKVDISMIKDKSREMNQDELTLLRQITGILNWTVRATRPDLAFDCVDLSTNFKGGKVEKLKEAQSCMNRMKKNKVAIKIPSLDNLEDCQVWVYTDAAYRNLNNNTDSCGGYVIFLVNIKNGKAAVVEWKANKLKRKVHSTLGAETQILSLGLDAALGVKTQIKAITNGEVDLKVRAITDNKSARDAVYSESEVQERMLRADIAIIKEMIEEKKILEVRWVKGQDMLADLLTKKGVKKDPLLDVIQSGRMSRNTMDIILN